MLFRSSLSTMSMIARTLPLATRRKISNIARNPKKRADSWSRANHRIIKDIEEKTVLVRERRLIDRTGACSDFWTSGSGVVGIEGI